MGMPLWREAPKALSLSLSLSPKFRFFFPIAFYKFGQEAHHLFVPYPFLEKRQQDSVVNAVEEFLYVAFQRIARSRVIFAFLSEHIRHNFYTFVASFSDPAGKGMRDESLFEYGIQNAEYRMMNDTVSYSRLMYMPTLRVADKKSFI